MNGINKDLPVECTVSSVEEGLTVNIVFAVRNPSTPAPPPTPPTLLCRCPASLPPSDAERARGADSDAAARRICRLPNRLAEPAPLAGPVRRQAYTTAGAAASYNEFHLDVLCGLVGVVQRFDSCNLRSITPNADSSVHL